MFCVKCGNKLDDGDIFCCKCGNRVGQEEKNPQSAKLFANKCEGCGAKLNLLSQGHYLCEYCGSEFFTANDSTIINSKISEKEIMDVFHRAAQFELNGNSYEELMCLLSISEKASDNVMALVKIGRAYRRNNMLDKAVEYYQKAISVNQNYANAYCNLGAVYIFTNEYEKAFNYLKVAIDLMNANRTGYTNDDYAIAHSNYAIAVGKLGRKEEAKRFLEIAEKSGYSNGNAVRKMIGIKQGFWR